jgi:hypothetical protein
VSHTTNGSVVEVVISRRKAGTSREAFIHTMTLAEQKLKLMPGFQRRQLLEGTDDSFVDLVWWDNMEAAQTALSTLNSDADLMGAFGMVLDPDHMTMMHLSPVTLSQA